MSNRDLSPRAGRALDDTVTPDDVTKIAKQFGIDATQLADNLNRAFRLYHAEIRRREQFAPTGAEYRHEIDRVAVLSRQLSEVLTGLSGRARNALASNPTDLLAVQLRVIALAADAVEPESQKQPDAFHYLVHLLAEIYEQETGHIPDQPLWGGSTFLWFAKSTARLCPDYQFLRDDAFEKAVSRALESYLGQN